MRRKNPYYGEPISLTVVGLGVLAGALGMSTGLSIGTYLNIRETINEIQNYDGLASTLKTSIDGLRAGKLTYADVRMRPTLMLNAPVSARQAYLQAGWYIMQAASRAEGDVRSTLLNAAETFWDDSESASKDILEVTSPKIHEPLQAAILLLQPFGENFQSEITMLYANTSIVRLSDQSSFEKENFDPAKYVKEAIKDTGKDVFLPFEIAGGLFTGKKPFGMSMAKWNLIRFSIYGGVGLALTGYVLSIGKPYIELIQKRR
jgi:hypothetical protein